MIEESYAPDRTKLSLNFIAKEPNKASEQSKRTKQANKRSEQSKRTKTEENHRLIIKYLRKNGLSKASDIAKVLNLSAVRTRAILKDLQAVESVGITNNRMYRLKNDKSGNL